MSNQSSSTRQTPLPEVHEPLKLESALARLSSDHKIVVMHYTPIRATIEGEPVEIFPFLGSSRLEKALTRVDVTAVPHGHAHKGAPADTTQTGIPVFNVAHTVLTANYPDKRAFRLFEVDTERMPDPSITGICDRRKGRRAEDQVAPSPATGNDST